jgi:hypothetical protein
LDQVRISMPRNIALDTRALARLAHSADVTKRNAGRA